jgi:hypothetical protein
MVTIQIKRRVYKAEKAPETARPGGRRRRNLGLTRMGSWLTMKA